MFRGEIVNRAATTARHHEKKKKKKSFKPSQLKVFSHPHHHTETTTFWVVSLHILLQHTHSISTIVFFWFDIH